MHRSVSGPDSVSLVYLSVSVPIPHCLNYCSFVVIPGIGRLVSPSLVLLFWKFLGMLWPGLFSKISLFWKMMDEPPGL